MLLGLIQFTFRRGTLISGFQSRLYPVLGIIEPFQYTNLSILRLWNALLCNSAVLACFVQNGMGMPMLRVHLRRPNHAYNVTFIKTVLKLKVLNNCEARMPEKICGWWLWATNCGFTEVARLDSHHPFWQSASYSFWNFLLLLPRWQSSALVRHPVSCTSSGENVIDLHCWKEFLLQGSLSSCWYPKILIDIYYPVNFSACAKSYDGIGIQVTRVELACSLGGINVFLLNKSLLMLQFWQQNNLGE